MAEIRHHTWRMLWNIYRIRIRQKNVYWWAVLTACRIWHLSRWRRRRIYFIRQVKGRAIMWSYHFHRKKKWRQSRQCMCWSTLQRMCLVMIMRRCMQFILTGNICMGIWSGIVWVWQPARSIIHLKAIGRIICSRLQINIVMSLDFP